VGQSLRTATVQGLVDRGLPLGVLVPIAPDMLFTIHASGDNGRGGDVPYVGRAIIAVSHPAPPSRPVTTAVATVPIASPTVPIASPTVVARTIARSKTGESTRAAGRQDAPPRRASTATSGARTVAPARGTPARSPGPTKHVPTVVAPPERTDHQGPSHQLNRGHDTAKATDRQKGHDNGVHRGHQKGHDNGLHKGHQKGHDNGLHKGHQKGHDNGLHKGHQKQDQKGHSQKPH
jgi:hypothetical protein